MSQRGNHKGSNREKRLKTIKQKKNEEKWTRSCRNGELIKKKKRAIGYSTVMKKACFSWSLPSAMLILVLGVHTGMPGYFWMGPMSSHIHDHFYPMHSSGISKWESCSYAKVGIRRRHKGAAATQSVLTSSGPWESPPCWSGNLWTPKYSTPKYSLST